MTDEKLIATRILAVIREVYEEGRSVVGERWSLFKKMKEMADRNDAVGMVRYFEECLGSERGKRVGDRLRAEGKKSLELEAWRIWDIVGEALVEARIDCISGVKDAVRRKRLEESFEAYWKREPVAQPITAAIRRRLRGRAEILPDARLHSRLAALPFVCIRRTGPEFNHIRSLAEQATAAYLFGLFEASAVIGRAALEVALVERWRAARREPPRDGTPDRLTILLQGALPGGAAGETQKSWARTIKTAGDAAAHGGEVDAARARSAIAALRRLFTEIHW